MSEHTEQSSFFTWTEMFEAQYPQLGRFWAVPNGGKRPLKVGRKGRLYPAEGIRLKAEGLRAGILDVFNLTSSISRSGVFYDGLILEFKVGKNTLTPEQRDWKAHFESQGYYVAVPHSWVEAAVITIDYFGLPEKLKDNLPLHRMKGEPGLRKERSNGN